MDFEDDGRDRIEISDDDEPSCVNSLLQKNAAELSEKLPSVLSSPDFERDSVEWIKQYQKMYIEYPKQLSGNFALFVERVTELTLHLLRKLNAAHIEEYLRTFSFKPQSQIHAFRDLRDLFIFCSEFHLSKLLENSVDIYFKNTMIAIEPFEKEATIKLVKVYFDFKANIQEDIAQVFGEMAEEFTRQLDRQFIKAKKQVLIPLLSVLLTPKQLNSFGLIVIMFLRAQEIEAVANGILAAYRGLIIHSKSFWGLFDNVNMVSAIEEVLLEAARSFEKSDIQVLTGMCCDLLKSQLAPPISEYFSNKPESVIEEFLWSLFDAVENDEECVRNMNTNVLVVKSIPLFEIFVLNYASHSFRMKFCREDFNIRHIELLEYFVKHHCSLALFQLVDCLRFRKVHTLALGYKLSAVSIPESIYDNICSDPKLAPSMINLPWNDIAQVPHGDKGALQASSCLGYLVIGFCLKDKSVDLRVSVPQAIVLLSFNYKDQIPIEDLAKESGFSKAFILEVIDSINHRVNLVKQEDDYIRLNSDLEIHGKEINLIKDYLNILHLKATQPECHSSPSLSKPKEEASHSSSDDISVRKPVNYLSEVARVINLSKRISWVDLVSDMARKGIEEEKILDAVQTLEKMKIAVREKESEEEFVVLKKGRTD